jgi:hypothetical protein
MKRLIALLALAFLPVAAPALADQLPAPPATAYLVRCYNPSVCDGLASRGAVDPATFDALVRAYHGSEHDVSDAAASRRSGSAAVRSL